MKTQTKRTRRKTSGMKWRTCKHCGLRIYPKREHTCVLQNKSNNANIERLGKVSENMLIEAFVKQPVENDFEAVVLDYNGERTLALAFVKNTKMQKEVNSSL